MPNWEHVKQLIAGTGISLEPTDGKGEVTITNTGGGGGGGQGGVLAIGCEYYGGAIAFPIAAGACAGGTFGAAGAGGAGFGGGAAGSAGVVGTIGNNGAVIDLRN